MIEEPPPYPLTLWRTEVAGLRVEVAAPKTAREVLQVVGVLTQDGLLSPWQLEGAMVWASPYITVEGEADTLAWMDTLSPLRALQVSQLPYRVASIGDGVYLDIEDLATIWASGGCQCRICVGRVNQEDARPTDLKLCKYTDTSNLALSFANHAAPLVKGLGDVLQAPWWIYQTVQAVQTGTGRAIQEQAEKQKIKEQVKDLITTIP